ncbi:DsbA family protein [Actinomadura viridis]|uniref:Protein-disulfide isomerase n=1 Tax=Actinomadura viridis TaxID=58110 RepID=A0A931GIM9_9ACTN|nr:thioredoxin domain-containing protein [Actinomadura viridis]MBG6088232.1 protein-disulfide isomerase [Actinomadura viridis]
MPPPPPGRKGGGAGLVIGLVAAALVVVVVAVVGVALFTRGGDDGGGGGGAAPPEQLKVGEISGGAQARPGTDGSLTMVRPGVERPVVEVYGDFACPHCGTFDKMVDPMLKDLAVSGKAKVIYRPMVIWSKGMEPMHGNALRAASALRCLSDGARWLAYQDALYAHQPKEQYTQGYDVKDLVSYAAPLGVRDDTFRKCVTGQQRAEAVLAASRAYTSGGVNATPTVRVNGVALGSESLGSAETIRSAIEARS